MSNPSPQKLIVSPAGLGWNHLLWSVVRTLSEMNRHLFASHSEKFMQQEESVEVAGGKILMSLRLSLGLRSIQTWNHFLSSGLLFPGIIDGSDCEGRV